MVAYGPRRDIVHRPEYVSPCGQSLCRLGVLTIMDREESFWSFSRRDLFKLLPSGMATWALRSPAPSQPAITPAPPSAAAASGVKKWLADWIWEPIEVNPSKFEPNVPFFQNRPFKNLFTYFHKTFDQPLGERPPHTQDVET